MLLKFKNTQNLVATAARHCHNSAAMHCVVQIVDILIPHSIPYMYVIDVQWTWQLLLQTWTSVYIQAKQQRPLYGQGRYSRPVFPREVVPDLCHRSNKRLAPVLNHACLTAVFFCLRKKPKVVVCICFVGPCWSHVLAAVKPSLQRNIYAVCSSIG